MKENQKTMTKNKKGFTLVELLIVISIIGILAGLGLSSYPKAQKQARDGKRKADLEQIRSALEIYRSDCKTYPATVSVVWGQPLVGAGVCAGNTYMAQVPKDSLSPTYGYKYKFWNKNQYCLCAYLETGGIVGSCNCDGNCGSASCNYKLSNP